MTEDILAGLVKPAAWIVHSPTRVSQFDEYPCLYAADRKDDAQNHARLMGAKCEPLFASIDIDKLRALVEALEYYASKYCEGFGECVGDFCGKTPSADCGGCRAFATLAALQAPPK